MRIKSLCALGATLAVAGAANAAFTGFLLEDYEGAAWFANGYGGLDTYRLYADFDSPDDFLIAGFGAPGQAMIANSGDGSFFNSAIANTLTAPLNLTPGIWSNQWDTYVTIGVTDAAGDATGVSPGFDVEVGGLAGNFSTENAAFFVTPVDPQGTAGNYANNNVLMAQFTVLEGVMVDGWMGASWNDASGNTTESYGYFAIPAPGALALLGLAGLVSRRRR